MRGYDFKDDPLKIKNKLPKYLVQQIAPLSKIKKLKTPNLKTAYTEALLAKTDEARDKKLKIAMYEKGRYYAQRIALNEANIEYMQGRAKEIMDDENVSVVRFKMSGKHPRRDICDYFANVDLYGLGKGIYPKAKAPVPPLHPFCRCRLIPKFSESAEKAKFNAKAEKDYISALKLHEQAQILGSNNRVVEFNHANLSMREFYNQAKPERYKVQEMGAVAMVVKDRILTDIKSLFETTKSEKVLLTNSGIFGGNKSVFISSDTVQSHNHHSDITANDYDKISQIIQGKNRVFVENDNKLIIIKKVDNRLYKLVIKNITKKDEIFCVSLVNLGTNQKNIDKELRRMEKKYKER